MQKNVTIRLDADLLRQLRHNAVEEGASLSAWIVRHFQRCKECAGGRKGYDRAKRDAMAALEQGLPLEGKTFSRDELHERPHFH